MQNTNNSMITNALTIVMMALFLVATPAVAAVYDDSGTPMETVSIDDQKTTTAALPGLAINYATFRVVGSGRARRAVAQQTRAALLDAATELGVVGRHSMTRAELEVAVAEAAAQPDDTGPVRGTGRVVRYEAEDTIQLPEQVADEYRGKVKRVNHPNDGGIVIELDDGTTMTASYSNWTALGQAMERGLNGFYYAHWTPAGGKSAGLDVQNQLLTQANKIAMKDKPSVRFVIQTDRDNGDGTVSPLQNNILHAVVTDTYTSIAAEDVYNELIEVLPPELYQYTLHGNNGIHAGTLALTQRDSDAVGLFNWTINIDCGKFNGMQSIRVTGGMRILFCANQISMGVQSLARELNITIRVGADAGLRRRHAGDLSETVQQIVECAAYAATDGPTGMVSTSWSTDVSNEEFTQIVDYYTGARGLSVKTRDLLFEAWDNPNTSQIPETLYGAIMAVTYAGTHTDEMKDGVEQKLRVMGGELLAISSDWEKLFPAIAAGAETWTENKTASLRESKPWAIQVLVDPDNSKELESVLGTGQIPQCFKTRDAAEAWVAETPERAGYHVVWWGTVPEPTDEPVSEEPEVSSTS